jgi:serine/threonine-protein kinase
MVGQTISHYRITRELGAGGMGVVYEAVDSRLDRTVAIKVLPPDLVRDREAKARFIHEAKAASALDHPNVCNIHEIDETEDGQLFLAMACYEGETLQEKIARGPLPLDEAIDIAKQVAEGLNEAHARDIVHRDIKPANLFVTDAGLVKILDFGLAKLAGQTQITQPGSTLGTLYYMSPEQAGGEEADSRTDLWSLGAVLYEMLTGRPPFTGDSIPAIVHAVLTADPAPVTRVREGLPTDLARIVERTLAKDPDQRHASAGEFITDLDAVVSDATIAIETRNHARRRARSRQRSLVYGLAAIVVVAALGVSWWAQSQSSGQIQALAVLPFANLSGDPDREFFADGMTDAIITELQQLGAHQLRVISWTSVKRYKDADLSLPEIADELGVEAIVEGTVTSVEGMVKVAAKLMRARPEEQMWAESYERNLGHVLALQSELARAVSASLRLMLSPDAAEARTVDPEAYEEYLLGLHLAESRGAWVSAQQHYEASIAADSTYAPAWTALAHATIMPTHGWPFDYQDVRDARRYAEKGIALDPGHAEGYFVLAHILWEHDWEPHRALELLERGLELNPSDGLGWMTYSECLAVLGRLDEATEALLQAIEVDPFNWLVNVVAPSRLLAADRFDEALAQIDRCAEVFPDPDDFDVEAAMSGYHYAREDYEWCLQHLEESKPAADSEEPTWFSGESTYAWYIWLKAGVLEEMGDVAAATGLRREWRRLVDFNEIRPTRVAVYYETVANPDSVFIWLERAYDQKDIWMIRLLQWKDDFGPVADDPRYDEWLTKLNLVN